MSETANSFCRNCHYPKSKHEVVSFNEVMLDEYMCPCDDTGLNFYTGVMFYPMTNLEYLEFKQEEADEIIRRRSS